ncbi:MAG: hypothetical protein MZV64_06575 [Ignavibacteriales bacterium]|nr:hypothetical protein [Ignavibacteriales bacterium]
MHAQRPAHAAQHLRRSARAGSGPRGARPRRPAPRGRAGARSRSGRSLCRPRPLRAREDLREHGAVLHRAGSRRPVATWMVFIASRERCWTLTGRT